MKLYYFITVICLFIVASCNRKSQDQNNQPAKQETKKEDSKIESITFDSEYIAYSFDFPVGKPDAEGYYNAQKFRENNHLGEDWNANTGGNSDLGDPIYAVASGFVSSVKDYKGGWGNVIRILHQLPNGQNIESLYAHCDKILVVEGVWVRKGEKIATIGNARGQYLAHLHFELRDDITLPIGGGYSHNTSGYLHPTAFIQNHR